MAIQPEEFRRALGHFATGVTVVTVLRPDGAVHGMTANAFSSVSLAPPLVLVCVGHGARTYTFISRQKRFGINLLRDDQEEVARFFAKTDQAPEAAGGVGVRYHSTVRGTPLVEPALAQLECSLDAAYEAGDHTIFIGRVEHAVTHRGRPLLFYRGRFCGLQHES